MPDDLGPGTQFKGQEGRSCRPLLGQVTRHRQVHRLAGLEAVDLSLGEVGVQIVAILRSEGPHEQAIRHDDHAVGWV
jgi:hypothetical protein